jgi:hypothetical protein
LAALPTLSGQVRVPPDGLGESFLGPISTADFERANSSSPVRDGPPAYQSERTLHAFSITASRSAPQSTPGFFFWTPLEPRQEACLVADWPWDFLFSTNSTSDRNSGPMFA